MKRFFLILSFFSLCLSLAAEDGSRLWLGTENFANADVTANKRTPTIDIALKELTDQWMGGPVKLLITKNKKIRELGREGFLIDGERSEGVTIQSSSDVGLLYGAYQLLRRQASGIGHRLSQVYQSPSYDLRLLNHWDNLDGSVECGYAGSSIWKWDELPETISPKYEAYARANASIGINGTVLNNINASPDILREDYLKKVKVLADIFRPYGIRVYLSVNFSSPQLLGGLSGSDPLNGDVQQWWKEKVKEIYRLIPDFGGFLVNANSKGQSGPHDYGRTHADGANLLAGALKPFGGVVMWRAFVHSPDDDDPAKQMYNEFVPLDGRFADNVILQIKSGSVDFQPDKLFSPLIGAMQKTSLMLEFQITPEYEALSNHLIYEAPYYKSFLDIDTWSDGPSSWISSLTDGKLRPVKRTAIAGVANIGDDANWTGHPFTQANWYAFGCLAWNSDQTPYEIAGEWIQMTFPDSFDFLEQLSDVMNSSRETVTDYTMPLGLRHTFVRDRCYRPEPWFDRAGREDSTSVYYHRADNFGLGFDRTSTGSNAVSLYFSPLKEHLEDVDSCPVEVILWFHHLPWSHVMQSGRILWDELCFRYDNGVQTVKKYQKIWDQLEPYIDEDCFREVQYRLRIQARDAVMWKDACLLYFQPFTESSIPYELERPVYNLEELKKKGSE